jgi:hypothetical protein
MDEKKTKTGGKRRNTGEDGFVRNYTALSTSLGVDRMTLNRWQRTFPDCPLPRCDGWVSVPAWRKWMRKHELAGDSVEPPPEHRLPDEPESREELNRQLIREKVRRERIKADLESGAAVLVEEIEVPLGALLAAIKNGIDAYPDRAAPMVQGFEDVPEIAGILHGEMQSTIGQLRIADFEHALEDVEESIRPAVEEALRKIGRKALETHCKRTP